MLFLRGLITKYIDELKIVNQFGALLDMSSSRSRSRFYFHLYLITIIQMMDFLSRRKKTSESL